MQKKKSQMSILINGRVLSFVQIPMDQNEGNVNKNSVIFSLKNQVGGLARALQVFQVYMPL